MGIALLTGYTQRLLEGTGSTPLVTLISVRTYMLMVRRGRGTPHEFRHFAGLISTTITRAKQCGAQRITGGRRLHNVM